MVSSIQGLGLSAMSHIHSGGRPSGPPPGGMPPGGPPPGFDPDKMKSQLNDFAKSQGFDSAETMLSSKASERGFGSVDDMLKSDMAAMKKGGPSAYGPPQGGGFSPKGLASPPKQSSYSSATSSQDLTSFLLKQLDAA